MAKSDVKSSRTRSGGGGSSLTHDDQGRGRSSSRWEQFLRMFGSAGFTQDWLMTVDASFVHAWVHDMTTRFNVHDWAWQRFTDDEDNDGRVRRIVIKKCGKQAWLNFQKRAAEIWQQHIDDEAKRRAEYDAEDAPERAAFEAKRIQRVEEERQVVFQSVQLVVGTIASEFNQAYDRSDRYDQAEGGWIDDPITTYQTGRGWGEEHNRATGIKLQITLSLDCSNSNLHNRVATPSAVAFRDTYVALKEMQRQYEQDLFVAAFEFSLDGRGADERGRVAKCLNTYAGGKYINVELEGTLGVMEHLRTIHTHYWPSNLFTGEDTWFYPLFEAIEKWENAHSDPGAHRLDIIISDAVIEHPSDIKRSDAVQERRNGSLQTVILNFQPVSEWVNSDLPMRCVQYPALVENIGGLLRQVIDDFVAAHV